MQKKSPLATGGKLGCFEENITVDDENLLYSMSNNIEDIEVAIYSRTGQNINLKKVGWKFNSELFSGVKHLMNKHQIVYSMTITSEKNLVVNMQINNEWLITGFTNIDEKYQSWEMLETAEIIAGLIKNKSKKTSDRKSVKDSENYEILTLDKLFNDIEILFKKRKNNELACKILLKDLKALMELNLHLEFCIKVKEYALDDDDFLLFLCFCNYYISDNDNYIGFNDLKFLYEGKITIHSVMKNLSDGNHILIKNGFIKLNNIEYYYNSESWKLSDEIKRDLLSEFYVKNIHNVKSNIISFDRIRDKKMFYNSGENEEVQTLIALLQNENYQKIQDRLSVKGMRNGFNCIFSGAPGTGKTETAYQIARETRRNIMKVDISETKSMWLGESEKEIKAIFDNYRTAVKTSEIAPILLLNEADAVIGKRIEFNSGNRSVDKTENRIQNIILEEMENFTGILIATTNMVQNMDDAFERRFLYKIIFDKPNIKSRKEIWKVFLPDLPEENCSELSENFDLSGGQIENIARKAEVDSILTGKDPSMDALLKYCNEESKSYFSTSGRIGFESVIYKG